MSQDLLNPIAAPENATVGDENLTVRDVTALQVNEQVPAQVTGPPAKTVDTVRVSETHIKLDEVITDPSSPLAVQIPDAGRGSLGLPIHRLAEAPKPEDVFAAEAATADEPEDDSEDDAADE